MIHTAALYSIGLSGAEIAVVGKSQIEDGKGADLGDVDMLSVQCPENI